MKAFKLNNYADTWLLEAARGPRISATRGPRVYSSETFGVLTKRKLLFQLTFPEFATLGWLLHRLQGLRSLPLKAPAGYTKFTHTNPLPPLPAPLNLVLSQPSLKQQPSCPPPNSSHTKAPPPLSPSPPSSTMGNLGLKLKGTRALTDQMQLKCNEDEKYWMADACEEIGKRCKSMAFGQLHRTACIKASGLELFLEIISLWEKDEIMIRPAFRALLQIVPEEGACEHLLEMGGRDVIDRAMNNHKEDPQIKGDGTKIMYALLGKGALVAMRDVMRVNKAIEYSVPLSVAETIKIDNGKRKQKRFNQAEEDLDHDLEKGQKAGILRVVTSMKKFSHDTSVQVGGIETMMVLARKGLNPRDIVAAGGVEALVAAMTSYPKSYQIQWRGCATITDFCDR